MEDEREREAGGGGKGGVTDLPESAPFHRCAAISSSLCSIIQQRPQYTCSSQPRHTFSPSRCAAPETQTNSIHARKDRQPDRAKEEPRGTATRQKTKSKKAICASFPEQRDGEPIFAGEIKRGKKKCRKHKCRNGAICRFGVSWETWFWKACTYTTGPPTPKTTSTQRYEDRDGFKYRGQNDTRTPKMCVLCAQDRAHATGDRPLRKNNLGVFVLGRTHITSLLCME